MTGYGVKRILPRPSTDDALSHPVVSCLSSSSSVIVFFGFVLQPKKFYMALLYNFWVLYINIVLSYGQKLLYILWKVVLKRRIWKRVSFWSEIFERDWLILGWILNREIFEKLDENSFSSISLSHRQLIVHREPSCFIKHRLSATSNHSFCVRSQSRNTLTSTLLSVERIEEIATLTKTKAAPIESCANQQFT